MVEVRWGGSCTATPKWCFPRIKQADLAYLAAVADQPIGRPVTIQPIWQPAKGQAAYPVTPAAGLIRPVWEPEGVEPETSPVLVPGSFRRCRDIQTGDAELTLDMALRRLR